jgi:hypothetical protein
MVTVQTQCGRTNIWHRYFTSSQDVTKLRSTAAVLPALSVPQHFQSVRSVNQPGPGACFASPGGYDVSAQTHLSRVGVPIRRVDKRVFGLEMVRRHCGRNPGLRMAEMRILPFRAEDMVARAGSTALKSSGMRGLMNSWGDSGGALRVLRERHQFHQDRSPTPTLVRRATGSVFMLTRENGCSTVRGASVATSEADHLPSTRECVVCSQA